jgi:indole-3-glycerol phosphate synthase
MDPLQLRLGYSSSSSSYRLRTALRRNKAIESYHQISFIPDLKRRSPTASPHMVADIGDMTSIATQLRDVGADALMVNADFPAYGGDIDELQRVVKAVAYSPEDLGPPVIMKDVIVHPIQLALAAEKGATAAVLIATVLGPRLEDLMDTATVMGYEVIVEVHSTAECSKALEYGANCLMVNQWDRVTGKLYPKLAENMRRMIPNEVRAT